MKILDTVPKCGHVRPAEQETTTSTAQIDGASDSNDLMPLDFLLAIMRDQADAVPKHGPARPAEPRTASSKAQIDGAMDRNDLTPLDFLLAVMRDQYVHLSTRIEVAIAALPYCHPKLASVKKSATVERSHEEWLKLLADKDDL